MSIQVFEGDGVDRIIEVKTIVGWLIEHRGSSVPWHGRPLPAREMAQTWAVRPDGVLPFETLAEADLHLRTLIDALRLACYIVEVYA